MIELHAHVFILQHCQSWMVVTWLRTWPPYLVLVAFLCSR